MCLSTHSWKKKLWYTYKMKFNSGKMKTEMAFAGKWIQLEIFTLIEISQAQKDKKNVLFYM